MLSFILSLCSVLWPVFYSGLLIVNSESNAIVYEWILAMNSTTTHANKFELINVFIHIIYCAVLHSQKPVKLARPPVLDVY